VQRNCAVCRGNGQSPGCFAAHGEAEQEKADGKHKLRSVVVRLGATRFPRDRESVVARCDKEINALDFPSLRICAVVIRIVDNDNRAAGYSSAYYSVTASSVNRE